MGTLITLIIGIVIGWFTAQFEFSQKAMVKIKELWAKIKAKLSTPTPPPTEPPAPTT